MVSEPADRGLSLEVLRKCDRERKTAARDGERAPDRISPVTVIALPLSYTYMGVCAHTHKFPMLCLAKSWQMLSTNGGEKTTGRREVKWWENWLSSNSFNCIIKAGSGSSGILRILGYLLTTLSFKLLSSIIFNNPWVNTQMNCSINYWKEIYK